MLAGVGVGGLALALAVPHFNEKQKPFGVQDQAARNMDGHKQQESLVMLVSRLAIMTVCLVVLVIRILIPLSAIWRARDPFRANDPGTGRILVVI